MSGARLRAWGGAALTAAALGLALWVRLWGLEVASSRTDEINFWRSGMGDPEAGRWEQLCRLWREPPWFNQMPTGDSIPAAWCGLRGMRGPEVGIGEVRRPFALLGWLGVAAVAVWLYVRRGWMAAWLAAVWLGLLPLHAYHSREAYYYAPLLGMAGLALPWAEGTAADALRGLERAGKGWNLALGAALMLGLCMTHMGAWAPTAAAWGCVGLALWSGSGTEGARVLRRRWMGGWTAASVVIVLGMSRWIVRALIEMMRTTTGEAAFIGGKASWVVPHILPFYCGGGLWMGWLVLAGTLTTALLAWWLLRRKALPEPAAEPAGKTGFHTMETGFQKRGKAKKQVSIEWKRVSWVGRLAEGDVTYRVTGALLAVTFAVSVAYVVGIGGGVAKMAYLLTCLPLFVAWTAMGGERLGRALGGGRGVVACVGLGLAVGAAFWGMARDVMRLEGRPTPYAALRDWLDENLHAGDIAIVDRWFEPWNEMLLYAPQKVEVSFTVPDEPYDAYVRNRWRDVTREVFERGEAQAFIRLTQNHAARMGVWNWPERFFAHHATVSNAVGLKMARNGSAPMEDFYDYPSRLAVEVFWDDPEDVAEKQARRGEKAWVSFGEGWSTMKPWQQGDMRHYRTLRGGETGELEVRYFGEAADKVTVEVTGVGIGGKAVCRAGRKTQLTFEPGMISVLAFDQKLEPGLTRIPFSVQAAEGAGLAVESIRVR